MPHRMTANGRYGICANWTSGIWWLRLRRCLFVIKARWNDPLFSERYGYYVFRLPLGFGWRFILKRDHPSPLNIHKPELGQTS